MERIQRGFDIANQELDEISKVDLAGPIEVGIRFEEHNGIAYYLN